MEARKTPIHPPYKPVMQPAPIKLPLGVHLGDLLTPDFIARHSRFAAEDEMFVASGFDIQSAQDFAAIPDVDWDRFIEQNTSFDTWLDMLQAAHFEWFQRNLKILWDHS